MRCSFANNHAKFEINLDCNRLMSIFMYIYAKFCGNMTFYSILTKIFLQIFEILFFILIVFLLQKRPCFTIHK